MTPINGPLPGPPTAAGDRWEAPGELTYNGVGLGSLHRLRSYQVTPVPDRAGRTNVYNRLSLAFSWYVVQNPHQPVGRSQNYLEFLQRALSKPAGHFRWDRRGVGLFEVNRPGAGGVRDVEYGPKPKVIGIDLLAASDVPGYTGDARSVFRVEWQVEVCIPQCSDAVYRLAPMEYGYEVSYRIDNGLTTRTANGYVRVPATRASVNDRAIPDTADRLREQVVPARIPGFRRMPGGEFRLDYSKTKLEFTVVDTQPPGPPPPPGVLEWDVSESLNTSTLAMTQWFGSIDVRYTIAPGFDPEQGQRHFLSLAADRIAALKKSNGVHGGKVFPTGMRIGATAIASDHALPQFTATLPFRLTAANLTDFLAAHGLWRPLPNTGGWAAWDRSMGAVFSPRGIAGLYFSPGEDQIVDLCAPPGQNDLPRANPPRKPPEAILRGGCSPRPPRPRAGCGTRRGSSWRRTAAPASCGPSPRSRSTASCGAAAPGRPRRCRPSTSCGATSPAPGRTRR